MTFLQQPLPGVVWGGFLAKPATLEPDMRIEPEYPYESPTTDTSRDNVVDARLRTLERQVADLHHRLTRLEHRVVELSNPSDKRGREALAIVLRSIARNLDVN